MVGGPLFFALSGLGPTRRIPTSCATPFWRIGVWPLVRFALTHDSSVATLLNLLTGLDPSLGQSAREGSFCGC